MARKVLAFDGGAERCGFACISESSKKKVLRLHGSGYLGVKRDGNESYQTYRLRLIEFWVKEAPALLRSYTPDEVVSEIIPAVGGGNFVVATQSQLAQTAMTTIQTVCIQEGVPVAQVGATTVKAKIGGGKKATKVQVRNGVFALMPETKSRKPEWTKMFDESDAYAICLTHLGRKNG